MADKLKVEILAVDRKVYDGEAQVVVARMPDGEVSILPDHIEAVMPLEIERLVLQGTERGELHVAVHGGTLYTDGERVLVLAETAELPDEIDVERAKEARERAKRRLEAARRGEKGIDWARAEAALRRALVRLSVAGYEEKKHG